MPKVEHLLDQILKYKKSKNILEQTAKILRV